MWGIVRMLVRVGALAAPAFWPAAEARAQSAAGGCPRIELSKPADAPILLEPIFYVAGLPEAQLNALSYKWTISAGAIVSGQGTQTLRVNVADAMSTGAEVSVEIGGLRGGCDAVISYTLPPPVACNRPLDEYGNIRFNDEKARLDNFAIELQNDPTAQGYIIAYGGRRGRAGEAQRRADRAKDYLVNTRGISADRIVTVDGGFREDLTVAMWIVPAGAQPPLAVPTVDPAEVEIITDEPESEESEPEDPPGRGAE